MRNTEVSRPLTPQERFAEMKGYYQQAIDDGRMYGGIFFTQTFLNGTDVSALTHEDLDAFGRKMNERWVGDPNGRNVRFLPGTSTPTSSSTT